MDRLDINERKPAGMEAYLSAYGWHFSKKMYEWALSMMKDRSGNKVPPMKKDDVDSVLSSASIAVDYMGYDGPYVMAMAKSDYYGSSITSESQLAKFVGDYLHDKDGYDGVAFTRFYADCIGKGIPVLWEEMM